VLSISRADGLHRVAGGKAGTSFTARMVIPQPRRGNERRAVACFAGNGAFGAIPIPW
jgi:hypothetical protein